MYKCLFGMFLAILSANILHASDSCDGQEDLALLSSKEPTFANYSFTVDTEPPYKFSSDRYAHERFTLPDGTRIHLEHRGCNSWKEKEVRWHYHLTAELDEKGITDPHEPTLVLDKALDVLNKIHFCGRKDTVGQWCGRIERAKKEDPQYRTEPGRPDLAGIWLSLEKDEEGNEIFLVLKLDKTADKTVLQVGHAFVWNGP